MENLAEVYENSVSKFSQNYPDRFNFLLKWKTWGSEKSAKFSLQTWDSIVRQMSKTGRRSGI